MTKQEKIKEAYGDKWDLVEKFVNPFNGKIKFFLIGHGVTNKQGYEDFGIRRDQVDFSNVGSSGSYDWRPKSLNGIENNNGWTKIESPEDLPKNDGRYIFRLEDGTKGEFYHDPEVIHPFATHWREIVEFQDPAY